MTPSPSDLTYFVEVANVLNLSRAAELLGISQPSLTLAMQRLEQCVGTPILIRHKRGVSLTKAGKQLLAHTRHLLQQWENIKSQTLASVHDVQGSFTIGCHTSVALYSAPNFLAELLAKYPRLEIKFLHNTSRKITEQVINLNIDIGIIVNPVKHPDLVIKHLDNDEFSFWQHAGGKLSLQSDNVTLLCDPELLQTQALLKMLKKAGVNYSRMIVSSSLEVIADLTKSGCGIGILPGNVAKLGHLVKIAKSPVFQDEICLLYRGENRDVKAMQVITDTIKSSMKKN